MFINHYPLAPAAAGGRVWCCVPVACVCVRSPWDAGRQGNGPATARLTDGAPRRLGDHSGRERRNVDHLHGSYEVHTLRPP